MPAAYPQFVAPFRAFLNQIPPGGRVLVYCHFDADGLAAGALFGRGLPRINATWQVEVLPSGKGENAFLTPSVRERLLTEKPAALIVTDLGYLPEGRVAVAGRAASRQLHIPDLLREAFRRTGQAPPENFAHGHPQASGGHLTVAEYAVLLRGLGFK